MISPHDVDQITIWTRDSPPATMINVRDFYFSTITGCIDSGLPMLYLCVKSKAKKGTTNYDLFEKENIVHIEYETYE